MLSYYNQGKKTYPCVASQWNERLAANKIWSKQVTYIASIASKSQYCGKCSWEALALGDWENCGDGKSQSAITLFFVSISMDSPVP